jgi:2-polyprenyl-3-methyl-5-hydroxy-6-metoxy-1,4-benzoquinol methylase
MSLVVERYRRIVRHVYRTGRRWTTAVLPYRPTDASTLDVEYASGAWEYLRGPTEVARFAVIAGYIQVFRPGASVLEIGCGEGILQERLNPASYSRYLGVDISPEAIRKACVKQRHRVSFVAADANAYTPDEQFDAIVFNECLEYFAEPLTAVHRYEAALRPHGLFIISMFASLETAARTSKIWRSLRTQYRFELETQVRDRSGYTWNIKVATPWNQPRALGRDAGDTSGPPRA